MLTVVPGATEAEVRLQLVEEEDRAVEDGEPSLHHVNPSALVVELLDVEEQQ